jgi:hypothetical protein
MACRVGGPNLVTNSAGFENYKSVLRKSGNAHQARSPSGMFQKHANDGTPLA